MFQKESHEGEEKKNEGIVHDFDGVMDELQQSISAAQRQSSVHYIVDSFWFNMVITLMVALNTVQLGIEADHPEFRTLWTISENLFTAAFFIEMIIKLVSLKLDYFKDKANWLDGVLTLFGVLDCWILSLMPGDTIDLQSMSILRILRLARLARMVRLLRRVKQFILVISGVFKALQTTIWVFLLLIFVIYVCAIFCTEYIGRGQVDLYPGYSKDEAVIDEQETIANFNPFLAFGDMRSSMLTLFNIAIGGEWAEVVRPMAAKQPVFVLLFAVYAMLMAFGLMNVMMAIIVDSVIAESKKLDKEMQEKHKSEKRELLHRIEKILKELDTNLDHAVDANELKHGFNGHSDLHDLLSHCDLPAGWTSSELLFMLDNSGDGVLQKNEFTTSFFRLIDSDDFQEICIMQSSLNQVKHLVRQAHDKLEVHMAEVRQSLTQIQSKLHITSDASKKAGGGVIMADTDLDGEAGEDEVHCDYDEELKRRSQQAGNASSIDTSTKSVDCERLADTTLDGEAADGEINCGYDEIKIDQQQSETRNDIGTSAINFPSRSGMQLGRLRQVAELHPCEEPSRAATYPSKHVDTMPGLTKEALEAQELQTDIKSIPLRKITDLLDVSFLAMKEALCKQVAMLSQAQEMSAISEAAAIADGVASTKCIIPAEGEFTMTHFPEKEPGALHHVLSEMTSSGAVPHLEQDSKQTSVVCSAKYPDQSQCLSFNDLKGTSGWQELDLQPDSLQSSAIRPNQADQEAGPLTAETGEDFESVASDAQPNDAGVQVKLSSMPDDKAHNLEVRTDEHMEQTACESEEKVRLDIRFQRPLVGMAAPGSASDSRGEALSGAVTDRNLSTDKPSSKDEGVEKVTFECEEKLGFEIRWYPDQLPLVGMVVPGSASHLGGVLEGDQLMKCNGISLEGRCRDDSLMLLQQRPLLLSLSRSRSVV